jgi:hypothetical protein
MKNQYLLKFPILLLVAINILSACSIGTNRVTIPNLSEVSLSSAESILLKLNLIPFYITKYDDNVPEGKVIATIPEADSKVDAFSRVQLIVSNGPRALVSTSAFFSPQNINIKEGSIEWIIADNPKIIDDILEIYLTITLDSSKVFQWSQQNDALFGLGYFKVTDGYAESLRLPLTFDFETLDIYPGIPQTITLKLPLNGLGLQTVNNLQINFSVWDNDVSNPFNNVQLTFRLAW